MAAGIQSSGPKPLSVKYSVLTALSPKGVHPALQVASSWSSTSRRRRKTIPIPMDQQRCARSTSASDWFCTDTASPFGSRSRRSGVGRRSRSRRRRGIERLSMRRIKFLLFLSFLPVLYHALGHFLPIGGASLTYTEGRVTPFCMIQWPANIPPLLQFFHACHLLTSGSPSVRACAPPCR